MQFGYGMQIAVARGFVITKAKRATGCEELERNAQTTGRSSPILASTIRREQPRGGPRP